MANDIYAQLKISGKDVVLCPVERNLYKTKDYNFFEKGTYVVEIHFNAAAITAAGTELLIKTGYTADATDNAIYNHVATIFKGRGIKQQSDLGNMNNFTKKGQHRR